MPRSLGEKTFAIMSGSIISFYMKKEARGAFRPPDLFDCPEVGTQSRSAFG